jgi:putative hydrolase of the HAD superfamily
VTGPRGLLLDYGGVLTTPVDRSFAAFEAEHGLAPGTALRVLLEASRDEDGGLIGAIERGELDEDDLDVHLRELLAGAELPVPPGPLLAGLFAGMQPAGGLWAVARQARDAGVRVGLLSNSWGLSSYPWDELEATFHVRVISGEVGLRKPDAAIYELALDRLGVPPERTTFVDDLRPNVDAARALGIHGVWHRGDDEATTAAISANLGMTFDPAAGRDLGWEHPR